MQNFADVDAKRVSMFDYISSGLAAFEGLLGMLQRKPGRLHQRYLQECVLLMRGWESTIAQLTDLMHRHCATEELDLTYEMVMLHCRASRLREELPKFRERMRELVAEDDSRLQAEGPVNALVAISDVVA
ncbi:hypothetical protein QFC20_003568 [Naganishia adeliensis]|uniref:Uncharacterized protein n=1 Tax=Naganishia adeliensis TaxID=92952 RepID=A0ACC2W8X5_9TREE|nr:hypothetical protein QFC20_003568 [Naganishia adeliensis]